MNHDTQIPDLLTNDEPGTTKLNSGLNVLTILTYIGCAVFGLFTLLMPFFYDFLLNFMDKAVSSGKELSAKELAKIEHARASLELAKQNMIPLMITGLLGIVLCFVGALWMRKLKKDGYWLYVAGELLPLIASGFIMGTAQYDSFWSILSGVGIPVIFVVLYTIHRKYLVN